MKKYYTPEIEFEIISTSDICTGSKLALDGDEGVGYSYEVKWSNTDLWKPVE